MYLYAVFYVEESGQMLFWQKTVEYAKGEFFVI